MMLSVHSTILCAAPTNAVLVPGVVLCSCTLNPMQACAVHCWWHLLDKHAAAEALEESRCVWQPLLTAIMVGLGTAPACSSVISVHLFSFAASIERICERVRFRLYPCVAHIFQQQAEHCACSCYQHLVNICS